VQQAHRYVLETLVDPGPPVPAVPEVDADGEPVPAVDAANDYERALRTLDAYFVPKVNEPFERHVFRAMKQTELESVDQFVARLKNQAHLCNFTNTEVNIRDQLIEKCRATKLK
jgi:hypothetical protein